MPWDEPSATAGQPLSAAEGPQPSKEPGKRRRLLYVTLPGCWGAIIFGCLSFTPSPLPRSGLIQGIVCGITAAIGYGLGVLLASIWRAFADRGPRAPRRWAWPAFFIGGAVLFAVSFGLGQYWQYEIRKLMGVTEYNVPLAVASPFIAALFFSTGVPAGHGHKYTSEYVDAWNTVLRPADITGQELASLRNIVADDG